MFVCIWEGIQIQDDTDLVVAHFTPNLMELCRRSRLFSGRERRSGTFGFVALSAQPRLVLFSLHSPLRFTEMSYFLPHLPSGWHVDEAIKSEEDRVVVLRFGHDWDSQCMTMDETLYAVAEKVQNFAVIYLVDITDVPDFNKACQM